jgi:hypothetical protein
MEKLGFYIRKLRVTGNQKRPAEIQFTTGLNVVAGASNTGKSYIFQCIDYLLGARKIPKEIDESKGYTTFELEIESHAGRTVSLKRTVEGKKYLVKFSRLDEDSNEEEYADHLTDDQKNISTLLLELCGFDNIQLKKSRHEKIRLSFRDIAGLTLIDEKQIITEDSPVYSSSESVSRTKEQSLFYFLLTGKDAQDFIEGEDPKVLKNKINGKIELVKELLDRTQEKLNAYKGENTEDLKKLVTVQLDSLNLEYNDYLQRIDAMKKSRNLFGAQKTKKESELLFKKELLERFSLLHKHYLSDLERLRFIAEGNFLLEQLNNITCPLCGSEITKDHLDCLTQYGKNNNNLEQATKTEVEKIALKLSEIELTTSGLKAEIEKTTKTIKVLTEKIVKTDAEIAQSLTPVTTTLKERINGLFRERSRLDEYNRLRDQVTVYTHQINELNQSLKTKTSQNKESIEMNKASINKFCRVVDTTLQEWKFPDVTNVSFDSNYPVFDIKINNTPRASNGKGYRAITYSAFLVSLMKYCKTHNRPYSYNLVLDSALTTFKDRDRTDVQEGSDASITTETEYAFFENLSQLKKNFQIILLDNKEPTENLKDGINFIHFSGQEGIGRKGFFA